jgi:Fascin domain
MAVPNHKAIVDQVNAEYPHLLQYNTPAACAEFLQRLVKALPVEERWGLLSKSEGEAHYTYPNGQMCSYDYVAVPAGDRVDVIASAAGHDMGIVGGPAWAPAAPHEWRPSNVWVDIASWPIYDSGTPVDGGGGVVTPCTLAFGWFCWMRAWADWPSEAQQNLDWIMGEIGPQVWRVMLAVEGQSHGSPDVWTNAGVFIDATWEDRYKKMLDQVGKLGTQVHATVYGGRNQTPTHDDRCRFHDRIIAASEGRWAAIRSFEMMNEFKANHWVAQEVRDSGRDLRSKLPANFLLSLSSPAMAHSYTDAGSFPTNEDMQASFDELYGGDGAGANEITIHTMRDGAKWSDPYSYNYLYPAVPKINNEPPGPGSSAGGMDTTADDVRKDLSNTIGAGWPMYVGHSEWSVWNGHLPQEYYNGWREIKFLKDLPNMPECAAVMKELAGSGEGGGGGEGIGPTPPPVFPATVSLTSAHGKMLTAELDGSVNATRVYTEPGPWETWTFESQGELLVALKSHHGGYLCADDGGGTTVTANRIYESPGPWEIFTAVPHSGGYALLCHDGLHYVTADLDGVLRAEATSIGEWEIWTFTPEPAPWAQDVADA